MGDNVTRFDSGMSFEKKGYRPRHCPHRNILLEAENRAVICKGCGKTLDPFETLLMYSAAGHKKVRRYGDAEDAAEAIDDLVSSGGSISIGKAGVRASVPHDGGRISSKGSQYGGSIWLRILDACKGLEDVMRWRR